MDWKTMLSYISGSVDELCLYLFIRAHQIIRRKDDRLHST